MGKDDYAVKKTTRFLRDIEHGRIAISPTGFSSVKRDLFKDLDNLETKDDDGLNHVKTKDFNCVQLVDGPMEGNSHTDDICHSMLPKKSKTSIPKTMNIPLRKKGTKVSNKMKVSK